MGKFLQKKHLIQIDDLSRSDIEEIFALAEYYLQKNKNLFLEHYDMPEQIELSNIMTIDPSTRKNLEINTSLDGEKNLSLLGVVDKTCSVLGSRLLKRRLNGPSTQSDRIFKWQGKVSEFYNDHKITGEVRALISKFPDTERALSRLIRLGPCLLYTSDAADE